MGASARASEDAEGGELAQLMESLGDSERAGAASARFGKGDKVRRLPVPVGFPGLPWGCASV